MSRLAVYSDQPGGGDRFWLDSLGTIYGLSYDRSYPGGAETATWQMILDPRMQHRAWAPGRQIGIVCGVKTIWTGLLDNPTRGTVWTMNAIGSASSDSQRMLAIAPTSGNALNLDEVIDAAIARTPDGLPWIRSSTLPSLGATAAAIPSGTEYIDDILETVMAGQNTPTYWTLSDGLVVSAAAAPTVPTYILLATGVGGGRTLDGFVTDVVVTYQSATGQLSTVTVSASSRPFGRFEVPLDITSLGLIPSTQATAAGQSYLAINGARAKFTDLFTVTAGQLITIGGQAVDLATFEPGVLVNVLVTDPDAAGEVALESPVPMIVGYTTYDVDSGVLGVGSVDYSSDSLASALFTSAT